MKKDLVNPQAVSFQEAQVILNWINAKEDIVQFLFKEFAASLNIPMFEVAAHEIDFIDIILKTMISDIQCLTELHECKITADFIYDLDISLTSLGTRLVSSVVVESHVHGEDYQNAAENEQVGIVEDPPITPVQDVDDGAMARAHLDFSVEQKTK